MVGQLPLARLKCCPPFSAARNFHLLYPRFAKDYPRFSPQTKKTLKTGGKKLVIGCDCV